MRFPAGLLILFAAACAPARPVAYDREVEREAPSGTYAPAPEEGPVVSRREPTYVRPSLQPPTPTESGEPRVVRSFVVERETRSTQREDLSTLPPPTEAEMTQALPEQRDNRARRPRTAERYDDGDTSSITFSDLDRLNGTVVTVTGRFSHKNYKHGILRLDNGLVLWLPHLDQFEKGTAWLNFVGRNCTATGVVQTNTLDIEGYEGPSLDLRGFSGP